MKYQVHQSHESNCWNLRHINAQNSVDVFRSVSSYPWLDVEMCWVVSPT